ncbi:Uncharacterized [Syntrophomonas zehnderi OL-4]|uniref:Uncharacterized n=1 Tax=Syntrophomonas zehnderi OL-4 TaxID=690567 RepID=A0A0E4G9D6_9FIRM|nr:hypothetical protein [Syntrophomonas zehnderi]CFX12683.1 Uncharacterized [Syntrophomonas zehnderi OL-4]
MQPIKKGVIDLTTKLPDAVEMEEIMYTSLCDGDNKKGAGKSKVNIY